MTRMSELTKSAAPGVWTAPLRFTVEDGPFSRVDLVFTGVDHSDASYEVRAYLNDPEATFETPRDPDRGYAGRFVVFGHGGCFGDDGHCEVPAPSADRTDLRLPHQLTPATKLITITDALTKVLAEQPDGLYSVTLVAVSKGALRANRGPTDTLARFDTVELQSYLSGTEMDAVEVPVVEALRAR
jgi:hypothetical protein